LLVAHICPICSLLSPCPPGAALRDLSQLSRFQGTSRPLKKGGLMGKGKWQM